MSSFRSKPDPASMRRISSTRQHPERDLFIDNLLHPEREFFIDNLQHPERDFFIGNLQHPERHCFTDNLLVRIHFIIGMMRWTGLAPWEFEFPFPGSFTSTFLVQHQPLPRSRWGTVLKLTR
jgi:hypothetical protein